MNEEIRWIALQVVVTPFFFFYSRAEGIWPSRFEIRFISLSLSDPVYSFLLQGINFHLQCILTLKV